MAEAVFDLVTEKLEWLLVETPVFLADAEEIVRLLIDYLKTSSVILRLREKRLIHQYVMSVTEIAHDADVSIDTFIANAENSRSKSHLNNFIEEFQSIGCRIAAVEADIINDYQSLEKEKDAFDIMRCRTVGLPQVQEEDRVGLEGEVNLLLEKAIFERTQEHSILYIMGMGGIGKTALASLLYNHPDVVAQFEIRAWVHTSNDSPSKNMLVELIQQLGMEGEPENLELLSLDNLRARVFHHLERRTYFIILDNVWSVYHLDFVFGAFPREYCKSRLVITSRSRSSVREDLPKYIHEKRFLDDSKSWELFLKKVFPRDRRCPKHLEKIGRQIARKCKGLPLAINEAGRKLAEKEESESVWQEFHEFMDLSDTSASLEISFDRLSTRLKLCFSRLGFFKEGTTIRVDKLLHICVAGGMLPQGNRKYQTDEEIGRQDLEELIGEYLVQVKDRTRDYQVKNCDINYNLHRLAITKAKHGLMFEVMDSEGPNHQSSHKRRHRAICCSRDKLSYSTNQDKHLVSLFFRGGGCFGASRSYWESFKLLKILDFEGFGLKTLPETVGKLITLKYLGLRNNCLQELPSSLGQLKKLEVLDIALNFLVEVPNIIWKMDSLRHLYMSDIICGEPLKIDQLRQLQTLTYISLDNWIYKVSIWYKLTSLRKLGIEEVDGNSDVSRLFKLLKALRKLEHLILRGFRFRSMPKLKGLHALYGLKQLKLDGLLTRLPNKFPPNIEYLNLSNSCLYEDPMPILEKLSSLLYLKLRNAFIGERMVISQQGFSKLQTLCIEELWHLKSVQAGEGAMPLLRQFEIRSCPYLKTFAEEVQLANNMMKLKMVTAKDITAISRKTTGGKAASSQQKMKGLNMVTAKDITAMSRKSTGGKAASSQQNMKKLKMMTAKHNIALSREFGLALMCLLIAYIIFISLLFLVDHIPHIFSR